MKWVKIDNEIFNVEDGSVQFSIGSHATIYLTLDISTHKTYQDFFIKLYESQQHKLPVEKFTIISAKFTGLGSLIKSLDTDFSSRMNLQIRCDMINLADVQGRRNDLLSDLLEDETLVNKNNIK